MVRKLHPTFETNDLNQRSFKKMIKEWKEYLQIYLQINILQIYLLIYIYKYLHIYCNVCFRIVLFR